MPARFENWPELLAAFFAQHRETPFVWGRFDCALFAADAIHIMTGVDPAEPFRLQYSTARGAARKLREFSDGGGLEETAVKIALAHGFEEIAVDLGGRGDLVLFDREVIFREGQEIHMAIPTGVTLGIVAPDGRHAALPGAEGLEFVPLSACRRAWRIA